MRKKIVFIFGTILIAGSLAACGSKDSERKNTKGTSIQEVQSEIDDLEIDTEITSEENSSETSQKKPEELFQVAETDGGVTIIEYMGIGDNEKLEIPEEIEGKKVVAIGGIGEDEDASVFWAKNALKEVIIPDSIKIIGDQSFAYCENLEKVTFGTGVETLGEGAFAWCPNLKSVEFSEGFKSIGTYVFVGNDALEKAIIPASCTEIGQDNFINKKNKKLVIVTPSGSIAEQYAKENSIKVENN